MTRLNKPWSQLYSLFTCYKQQMLITSLIPSAVWHYCATRHRWVCPVDLWQAAARHWVGVLWFWFTYFELFTIPNQPTHSLAQSSHLLSKTRQLYLSVFSYNCIITIVYYAELQTAHRHFVVIINHLHLTIFKPGEYVDYLSNAQIFDDLKLFAHRYL